MIENVGRRDAVVRVTFGGALLAIAVGLALAIGGTFGSLAALLVGVTGLTLMSSGVNRTSWFYRHAHVTSRGGLHRER